MEKISLLINYINQYRDINGDEFTLEICRLMIDSSKELRILLDDLSKKKIDYDSLDKYCIMVIDYYINDYDKDENLDSLHLYLKEICQYPLLSIEEEQELFKRLKMGDKTIKEKIIHSNLKLVVSIAKRYSHGDEKLLMDYIQEGNIGLIKAVDRFDFTRKYKFSTYATDWIQKYILYYQEVCLNDIKKTSQVKKHKSLIDKASIFLENYYGRKPTIQEISKYTHLSVETIHKVALCYNQTISLNKKIDETKENEYMDFMENKHLSVEDEAINHYIREMIYSYLSKEEIELLKMRYGLEEQKIYTQEEIGSFYGVTKKAINLREKKVKEKLKKKSQLREFL